MDGRLLVAILVFAALGGWFAWRYYALREQLGRYARGVRQGKHAAHPNMLPEIDDLSSAVKSLVSTLDERFAALSNDHDRLAAVLDQMTDGALIADSDGKVQFANPAASRLFESADAVGRTVTEVLRHHQLVDAWRRSRDLNELQSESLEIPSRRQFLQLVVMPDRHAGGSLLFVQDLTRVRRLETVRRDFISNISHELRTPLASLKALTETLQGGALSDESAGPWFLERIAAEVDALTQMAQELLDLSRIESGQVELDLENLEPLELLRSAAARMSMQAERAELDLRVECAESLPVVRADRARVEQVLVNLIHNAVKFTRPRGSVVLSARSAASGEQDHVSFPMVCFAVSDTGIGIPAEEVARIFERFYRVDKSRTGGGTGLGLSISRHIVEAHGGKIWVESVEGQGSTFYFTIPTSS